MTSRTLVIVALLGTALFFSLVSALRAQRGEEEVAISRGGFAELAQSEIAAGHRVWVAPGTRMRPARDEVSAGAPRYLTETGLVVNLEREALLDPHAQRVLRNSAGRHVAFVFANAEAHVEVSSKPYLVSLVPGVPYRAFQATGNRAILAVDVCEDLWSEILTCTDEDDRPLTRMVPMEADQITLLDLEALKRAGAPFPAPMRALELEGEVTLERACHVSRLTSKSDVAEQGSSRSKLPSPDRYLASLRIDLETELQRANEFGPERAVRFTYVHRSDARPRRLAHVTRCSTGLLATASFRDARGVEFSLNEEDAIQVGAVPAVGRFEASCPLAHSSLESMLIERGLAPEDAAWFLAQTIEWKNPVAC